MTQLNISGSNKHKLLIALIATLICVLTLFATDIYAPSLPSMVQSLHTKAMLVKMSITTYLLGLSIAQLFFGPLSERWGRRKTLLLGLLTFTLGSALCLNAHSIYSLIFARLIQGIGAAAGFSLGRTIIRDLFSGLELAKVGSYVSLIISIAPALSPVLGGYLQISFGWMGSFWFLLTYSVTAIALLLVFMPETNKQLNKHATKVKTMLNNYAELITNRQFMSWTLISTACIASLITFFTVSPFLLQENLGLTPVQFGWVAMTISSVSIVARFINSALLSRLGVKGVSIIGLALMFSGVFILAILHLFYHDTIIGLIAPMLLFVAGTGFLLSNSMAGAFEPFGHIAGIAGSGFGALQMLGSFLASALVAKMPHNNSAALTGFLAFFALTSLVAFYQVTKRRTKVINANVQ